MRPDAGLRLDDRYVLRSLIAVGGMGEVWVAHDEALARDVAAKVLREEFAGDDGFIERFRTEARNSARLSHHNIAQLYDYGELGGSAWIVMELIDGEPLSDLLEREPVLPPSRVLPILAQTARALHAAHVAGVVHRDVKPGNILVSREGRVKITDFGISLASNQMSMTASGMVMGTAQYLAPEQALGRPAAPASDLYSLGVVAYEALVGRRPFTGPTAVDIAVAHVNKTVPPPPDSVPADIASLVMRLLSKDPEQRPRSAAVTARLLDELLGATPATGLPVARVRAGSAPHGASWDATAHDGATRDGATRDGAAPGTGPYAGRHAEAEPAPAGRGRAAPRTGDAAAVLPAPEGAGWWSDDADLRNLSRRTLRGAPGAGPAPEGRAGATGPAGPVGATGPVGAAGAARPVGAVGAVRPVGAVGTSVQASVGAGLDGRGDPSTVDAAGTDATSREAGRHAPPSFVPGTGEIATRRRRNPKPAPRRRPGVAGLWDRWQPVLTSPWFVLVLLVGIAVLGALFADRILGVQPPTEVGAWPAGTSTVVAEEPVAHNDDSEGRR